MEPETPSSDAHSANSWITEVVNIHLSNLENVEKNFTIYHGITVEFSMGHGN